MNKMELDTPFVLLNMEKVEQNIRRMQEKADRLGVALRPHVKTHKIPLLAHKQIEAGATGIMVAKLGEAEVMAAAGIKDILIGYPIVGKQKIHRLIRLISMYQETRIVVALDSFEAASAISDAAAESSVQVRLALEIDHGYGRVGLPPGEPIIKLARSIRGRKGVEVVGVVSFSGQSYEETEQSRIMELVSRERIQAEMTANMLRREGFNIDLISIGSTPAAHFAESVEGITELRAGTYIFGDLSQVALGTCRLDECALSVKVTIVSRPSIDRAVIDAGTKVFTSDGDDSPIGTGRGYVIGHPRIIVSWFNEEHGMLVLSSEDQHLQIGDTLEVIPNHCCAVMNMVDEVAAIRRDEVEAILPVVGRGKVQ